MGTNKRYGDRLGNDLDRRVEQLAIRPQPISLTDRELDKEHTQPRVPTNPVRVRAWVRFPETPIHTVAWAVAWTDRAVLVEWRDAEDRPMSAWVWGVRGRTPRRQRVGGPRGLGGRPREPLSRARC